MSLPIAHVGHWAVNLLYVAPLIFVMGALGWQSLRDRRRGSGARNEPSDSPPVA